MKKIKLTQNKVTLVSNCDFQSLNIHKWSANKIGNTFYVVRSDRSSGKVKTILMHRVILGAAKEMEVDHLDGDGLNNQRENLRCCTHSQNLKNRKKHKNNISGFKGVSFYTRTKQWVAFIGVDNKNIGLGYFKTKEEAYEAYCKACIKYHKEFHKL